MHFERHFAFFSRKKKQKKFSVSPVNLGRVGFPLTQVIFYLALLIKERAGRWNFQSSLFSSLYMHPIWASSRENLSSGFPPKRVLNQPSQLQRLAR